MYQSCCLEQRAEQRLELVYRGDPYAIHLPTGREVAGGGRPRQGPAHDGGAEVREVSKCGGLVVHRDVSGGDLEVRVMLGSLRLAYELWKTGEQMRWDDIVSATQDLQMKCARSQPGSSR